MKIRFVKYAEPESTERISMIVEHLMWTDMLDAFVRFLNAAGYSIDRENIEEWVGEAMHTLPDAPRYARGKK